MARPLSLNFPIQNLQFQSIPVSFLFVIISVFSVFSIVAFLCASHRTRKSLRGKEETISGSTEKRLLTKLNSKISSKAHTMVKMISWKKVRAEEEEEEEEDDSEEAVWRRKIIMGERCRPLDFSGKIVYDSEGNLLPDSDSIDRNRNKTIV
ncbi:putative Transmembrane protein [Melia azedarach]|uniref:Transmembrane protein n=1 Tax=Melia azedarach TaxID=155640 RepID=A0ACC1X6X6_MELAZ|nr:putative Transmembrane protein [Melia azedarach]